MSKKLKTEKELKEILENCNEYPGMIDIFNCTNPDCGFRAFYSYVDKGYTPNSIRCVKCNSVANSSLDKLTQPFFQWYRPKNVEEIKELAENSFKKIKQKFEDGELDDCCSKKEIFQHYVDHYNIGGLFCRPMEIKQCSRASN
jgi:hypothetical protein